MILLTMQTYIEGGGEATPSKGHTDTGPHLRKPQHYRDPALLDALRPDSDGN